jgi:glycosyltransferase involved in cell wall biosynthesis
MGSSLPDRIDVVLVDSTARSVPPPPAHKRFLYSIPRQLDFLKKFHRSRPSSLLVFASPGLSLFEKAAYCASARLWGIPSILFLRGGATMDMARKSPVFSWVLRVLLRTADSLPCQGSAWKDFLVGEMGLATMKCPLIANWTATASALRAGEARPVGATIVSKGISVLFMGWLDETKGVLDLLEAFSAVAKRHPQLPLFLRMAGEGKCSKSAREFAAQLGIANRVTFLGWLRGEALSSELKHASIFCLPSYKEGLPNAMIEAMAYALPVIVTPVGNIPDAVTDGLQGVIVPPANPALLGKAIESLALDPTKREAMGRAGHETARQRFSAEMVADKFISILDSFKTEKVC